MIEVFHNDIANVFGLNIKGKNCGFKCQVGKKKSFRKLFLVQKLDTESVKLTQRHRGCCSTLCHSEHVVN